VAIGRFLAGTLFNDYLAQREHPGIQALESLCAYFDVELVPSSEGFPCFLGRGSCARVFRVQDSKGNIMALKVVLRSGVDSIEVERANSRAKGLNELGVVITCKNHFIDPSMRFAGLLLDPVGRPMQRTRGDMEAALLSLKKLNIGGFTHGNSRRPNAVIVTRNGVEQCVWLDLETLSCYFDRCRAFQFDVGNLIHSFQSSFDYGDDEDEQVWVLIKTFWEDDGALEGLLDGISSIWQMSK
jgi:hypothetical protein